MADEIKKSVELWIGCIAGALHDHEYADKSTQAGFEPISIEPRRVYDMNDALQFLAGQGLDVIAPQIASRFMSAFIRAEKPRAWCGPDCCA